MVIVFDILNGDVKMGGKRSGNSLNIGAVVGFDVVVEDVQEDRKDFETGKVLLVFGKLYDVIELAADILVIFRCVNRMMGGMDALSRICEISYMPISPLKAIQEYSHGSVSSA